MSTAMRAFRVGKSDARDGADRAAETLNFAERDRLVKIVDHAVVRWPVGADKPDVRHGHEDKWHATGWGAFWGLLIGAVWAGPVVGALGGAGLRGLHQAAEEPGHNQGAVGD